MNKHVGMSQNATPAPATRNEATRRFPPKVTIGTVIWSSHGRLRRCGRLWRQRQRRANTPPTPRPPEWNRNLRKTNMTTITIKVPWLSTFSKEHHGGFYQVWSRLPLQFWGYFAHLGEAHEKMTLCLGCSPFFSHNHSGTSNWPLGFLPARTGGGPSSQGCPEPRCDGPLPDVHSVLTPSTQSLDTIYHLPAKWNSVNQTNINKLQSAWILKIFVIEGFRFASLEAVNRFWSICPSKYGCLGRCENSSNWGP